MKIALLAVPLGIACLFFSAPTAHAAEPPHIQMVNGTGQLIVNGHPFLILGGELGNSSSAAAAQADAIIPKLASMHVNTILTPVAWEQLEPKEGAFDFSILDHWIETASAHKTHLVLLWFGSWKNAFSNYAPAWVKSDVDSLSDLLPAAQAAGSTRGLVLHATSLRPTQTVALGGYIFEATLSRSWPARTLATDDGAMLILQSSRGEFYIVGSGLTVSFARDPDVDSGIAGIESIEEVSRASGPWTRDRRLNGDQTNQGRQLLMDAKRPHIYRVRLYSIPSGREP